MDQVKEPNRRTPPVRMGEYDSFHVEDDGWRVINNEELQDGEHPEVGPWIIEKLRAKRVCLYCKSTVCSARHVWGDYPNGGNCKEWVLVHCRNCAFWQFFCKHGLLDDLPSRIYWEAYASKARSFDQVLPPACESELAKVLRRDRSGWSSLDPRRLETFVADILRANYKESEVSHIGGSDDGGVDAIFVDSEQKQWLVQVKRRSQPGGEPVATLRNLLGAMYLRDNLRGIVVSTADHFTFRAQELRRTLERKGCVIQLVDRGKLDLMLSPLIPKRPWKKLLKEYDYTWNDEAPNGRTVFSVLERRLGMPARHRDSQLKFRFPGEDSG